MWKFLKNLWYLGHHTDELCDRLSQCESSVREAERVAFAAERTIRDRTDIAMDMGVRSPATVILYGKYKNMDYVEVVNVDAQDFEHLMSITKEMKRHGRVRNIDAPMPFRHAVSRQRDF